MIVKVTLNQNSSSIVYKTPFKNIKSSLRKVLSEIEFKITIYFTILYIIKSILPWNEVETS